MTYDPSLEKERKDRKKWLKEAYERGFSAFDFYSPSDFDLKQDFDLPNETFSVMTSESQEYRKLIREIEDYTGFERGKHDWDNFGIYPLIEDSSSAFEAGAYDGINNNEYNPERISHFWE